MIILSKSKLPEVIDLFSGCGGLALGFQMAGFRVTHGIELMENAVKNANYNLSIKRKEKGLHICGDITQLSESIFKNQIGPNGCIVIGGPPCQAYSLIGRAKLNSLMDEGSFLDDKRGFLFEDFLRFAIGLEAKAVVMENVKSCTAYGKLNVPEKVAEILERCGYTVYWTILNSADYGVPQIRERMILYAVKGDNVEPVLPKPTHSGKWFGGLYSGIGLTDLCNSGECRHFIMPRMRRKIQPRWLTVEEAIGDLPELHARAGSQYSPHSMNLQMDYVSEPQNDYQRMMRENTGMGVTANVYRNTKRDFPIFALMNEGDNFIQAVEIAERLFQEACRRQGVKAGTEAYDRLRKEIVPPYSTEKFLSKWKKLEGDKPSHTLVAHLSVDTYSHIHPWEPRGISVREAARLQSFPDDYILQCSMGDAFKQIGNSVPPLMAKGIAIALKEALRKQAKNNGFSDKDTE